MHAVARLLTGIFLVLVFFSSIVFSYFNTTAISLIFGSWSTPELPVSVWILAAFISGGAMGLLLGLRLFKGLKSRVELRKLQKQLKAANDEVHRLRKLTLNDLN